MEPSVARNVHYVSFGTPNGEFEPEHRAAIITQVYDGCTEVGLCVINPTGIFFNEGVLYDEDCRPGTWHWPERTE